MNKKHSIQYRQKVLIIAPQPFFQWRGSPIRVKSIVSELSKMGHSVDLLTFPIGENIEIPEVTIIRVANLLGIKNVKIGPSLSKIFFDILILFKGLQLIRSTKYSIIHGVEEGGIISVILSRKSGSKAIFEKHSDPASYKNGCFMNLLLSIYSKVEHLTVKYAHTIICTGPGLAKQVEMMHEEALVYTICDIPSSYIEPTKDEIFNTRQKFVENPDESLITFAGSFTTYQGIDLLMDAIIEVVN